MTVYCALPLLDFSESEAVVISNSSGFIGVKGEIRSGCSGIGRDFFEALLSLFMTTTDRLSIASSVIHTVIMTFCLQLPK